jgi:hypothetical protein
VLGTTYSGIVEYGNASISTDVYDASANSAWSGSEVTGASAYDTAAVAGVDDIAPTGSVTYDLFDNSGCTGPTTTDTITLTGGVVPQSTTTSALGAGSYSFDASYSGDDVYSGVTSSCEPFRVGQTSASVGTLVDDVATNGAWGGSEVTGAYAYDTATVTGPAGITPAGTVTYSFFTNGGCSGPPSTTDPVSLSGGTVPQSTETVALPTGSYSFEAVYSGDGNYVSSESSCETFAVGMATPSVATVVDDDATNLTWNGTEATGASAYDTATVTGVAGITPAGSVTYSFFDNATCSGTPATTDPVSLSAGVAPSSTTTGPLGTGPYSFQAGYSGDSNYTVATGSCEAFGVTTASASVGTVVDDAATNGAWNGSEVTGASAYDTATVTGVASFTPTGTVTYSLFANGTCAGPASETDTVTLSGGTTPPSTPTGALGAGGYSFDASYSGDGNYSASTATCESFIVAKASVLPGTVATDASTGGAWNWTEVTGASAYDTSTVSSVAGFTPNGSVTYSSFDNATCAGIASTTNQVTLTGGTVPRSPTTAALGAGNYSFDASYSGDANYASTTSDCEPFGVAKASPAVATAVDDSATSAAWNGSEMTGASAYDTSTVTGVAGFAPTGTVTYNLFTNGTCSYPATATAVSLGGGAVPSSSSTGALGAGSYSFDASYSGDPNYNGSTSSCESFSLGDASPAVGTLVDDAATSGPWSGTEATGASAYDTATVTGVASFTPTGTVRYSFFDGNGCAGPAAAIDTVTLSGGTVPQSSSSGALGAGSYSFDASYSGDGNYSASTVTCESFSVATAPVSPGTVVDDATTNAAWNGTEATGASAYDSATVTGVAGFTPTGTVTYRFFTNGTCAGTASTTDTVSLSATGTVPESPTTSSLGAGAYSFQASYSGDGNYTGSPSSCEPFSVTTTSASLGTVVEDAARGAAWNGTETTGASAYDTATVLSVAGVSPTGTVTYSLFDNAACTGPAATTQTVSLGGGTVPNSEATVALAAGSYAFQASYSGDGNYKGSTSSCEGFGVAKASVLPGTVVDDAATSAAWSGTEVTGTSAYDTATVTGVASFTPSGSVTYRLYATGTCAGTASSTQTVSLSGGLVPSSAKTAALGAGAYSFEASYSGDGNYTGSSGSCEPFSVAGATASVATVVNDAATKAAWSGTEVLGASAYATSTLTGVAGFTPTGTVTYSLFTNGTCAGAPSATDTVTVNGGVVPKSSPTPALAAGPYSFEASYSGDSNYKASASSCEVFSVAKDTTTTTVTESKTSVTYGDEQAAVFSVTVTTKHGEAVPNGDTVTVDAGFATCVAPLSAGKGSCEITSTALPSGSYSVSAVYGGDANLAGSSETCASKLTVTKDATTTTVSVSPSSVTYGQEQAAVFTVDVTAHYGEAVPNGDTVTVTAGSATCVAPLNGGKGTCEITSTALPSGSYSASAVYSGDAGLVGSSVTCATHLGVAKDTTTTKVSESPTSVAPGAESAAMFTVGVATHYGEAVPNGEKVTVTVGSTSCVATLTAGNGTCTITNSALKPGSYAVSNVYSGDANHTGSSATSTTKLTVT